MITSGSGPFVDDLRRLGIPVAILRHLSVPIHPLRDLRALREIRAAFTELAPDLVAAHSSKAGILGRLAGRSLRVPVVFTVHSWAFTPGVPALHAAIYRQAEGLVGPLASKIITVSEFDRRLGLAARIADEARLVTVHNGMPDVAPSLRALAAGLGLAGRVRFLGQRTDVDRLLADAPVSLLVSNWEGFPLSILEAMRAGLPVVASSVGGIDESVRDNWEGWSPAWSSASARPGGSS